MKTSIALFSTLMLCIGCGDEGGDLGGTFVTDFNITYDEVRIQRQETAGDPNALIVSYLRNLDSGQEIPVKVVAEWPVEQGVERDLVEHGSVEHITTSGAQFPDLELGTITFDTLGDVGSTASGEFFATFKGGGTLNGSFSGTLQRLTIN